MSTATCAEANRDADDWSQALKAMCNFIRRPSLKPARSLRIYKWITRHRDNSYGYFSQLQPQLLLITGDCYLVIPQPPTSLSYHWSQIPPQKVLNEERQKLTEGRREKRPFGRSEQQI